MRSFKSRQKRVNGNENDLKAKTHIKENVSNTKPTNNMR
jgi:hypothetical protein